MAVQQLVFGNSIGANNGTRLASQSWSGGEYALMGKLCNCHIIIG